MNLTKKALGDTSHYVTNIGLGLWGIGGGDWGLVDDSESLRLIDYSLDVGVNFFDTADVYNEGHSERVLGKAMRGRRNQFIVATKIGWRDFDEDTQTSAYHSVEKLIAGVETNLTRLGTDYIDVLQYHIDFREPNMEIFLEGFHALKREGKILAYGLSTSDFEYLQTFNADGACSTLQIDYSLLNRTAERDIFPYCRAHNIGVIIRGPLAMGILTGKFSAGHQFEAVDWRNRWLEAPEEHAVFLDDLHKVDQLKQLVREGRSLTQLAVQFALQHPAVTTVIPGAKTEKQFAETCASVVSPAFSDDEINLIDSITPPGGGRKIWPA
jgi:aryl-alcohol dehydrogenase-like predicted oxidoreductase